MRDFWTTLEYGLTRLEVMTGWPGTDTLRRTVPLGEFMSNDLERNTLRVKLDIGYFCVKFSVFFT